MTDQQPPRIPEPPTNDSVAYSGQTSTGPSQPVHSTPAPVPSNPRDGAADGASPTDDFVRAPANRFEHWRPAPSGVAVTSPASDSSPTELEVAEDIVPTAPNPVVVHARPRWWQLAAAGFFGAVIAVGGVLAIDRVGGEAVVETPVAQPVVVTTVPPEPAPVSEATGIPVPVPVMESDAVAVGEKVIPSIVTVEVGNGNSRTGTGSGVVVGEDGYVVTNNHVIEVGNNFRVVLSDGRTTYEAELIGADPLTDLAVLRIDADGLTPIELGAASALSVGDVAVAVGSPLGLEGGPSLTVGVVSAFGRQVQTGPQEVLYGMLQTDAPITQGSSGGALVDGSGRLIGITTAVGVSDVGVEGIGFATPVEMMRRVVDELIAEGGINHAFLGITGTTAFDTAADGANIAVGVEVAAVESGSAAAAAGVAAGDVITAIDGEPIETMDELIVALRLRAAGDTALVVVNGTDVEVTLGSR